MKYTCGQRTSEGYTCSKEALWLLDRSDFSVKEGWRVKDSMYCKAHRAGTFRRTYNKYSEADFLDLNSDASKPALNIHIKYCEQERAAAEAHNKQERERRIEMMKQANPAAWEEYTKPVRIKEFVNLNDGYAKNRNERKWTIVRTRGFDYDVEVEYTTLPDDTPWYQIEPVYVRIPQTSTLTPVEAREFAAMILQAADAADVETGSRRRHRERMIEKETKS